jgi:hypothetical protein
VATTGVAVAASEARERVFAGAVMVRVADVASPVAGLVALEVVELPGTSLRQRSPVAVARIEAVVHMAIETGTAVKPGTGPDE